MEIVGGARPRLSDSSNFAYSILGAAQSEGVPLPGLGPGIHVFAALGTRAEQVVDGRVKPGRRDWRLFRHPTLQPKAFRNRNRTAGMLDGDRRTPAPDLRPDKTGGTGGSCRTSDNAPGDNPSVLCTAAVRRCNECGWLAANSLQMQQNRYRCSSKGCGLAGFRAVAGRLQTRLLMPPSYRPASEHVRLLSAAVTAVAAPSPTGKVCRRPSIWVLELARPRGSGGFSSEAQKCVKP